MNRHVLIASTLLKKLKQTYSNVFIQTKSITNKSREIILAEKNIRTTPASHMFGIANNTNIVTKLQIHQLLF